MRGRINLVLIILIIFGAAIISRLFYLQVIQYKFYQAQALGQQTVFQELQGPRGEIFFKNNGESLAVDNDKWLVYADPSKVKDKAQTASVISKITGDKADQIQLKMAKQDTSYVVIKNNLPEDTASKIKNLNLPGIGLENNPGRYYPQETMASQVAGFLGGDGVGQYGLEGYYEDVLKGKSSFTDEPTTFALFNSQGLEPANLSGSDLYLTIDYSIQFEAESLLKQAKAELDMDSGQIIVLDPATGKIAAMANYPNFNPNQYSKEKNIAIFQNSAVQKLFECGSVFKPFIMAMGLNEGKITPDTTYVDEGFVKVGIEKITNFNKNKKYGRQTMTQVLEKSLNTGAVFVEQKIPHSTFLQYFDGFGFGEQTGIDLQGEVLSKNNNLRKGQNINFATASFGQGVVLTPIQLIRGFAAIANEGRLVKPHVVEKIVDPQKNETPIEQKTSEPILSQGTISQLTAMLISSVANGVAKGAQVKGYYVAGKTGTAQVPYENKQGYYPNKTVQSFVGFAPALNPKFVILVKLDNPKGPSSSETAAPIFSKLAQYILNYWQIPPDHN